jgi:hypothetical protein
MSTEATTNVQRHNSAALASVYQQVGIDARASREAILQEAAESFREWQRERNRRKNDALQERRAEYPRHDPPVGIMIYVQRSARDRARFTVKNSDPNRTYTEKELDREVGKLFAASAEKDFPPKYPRRPKRR